MSQTIKLREDTQELLEVTEDRLNKMIAEFNKRFAKMRVAYAQARMEAVEIQKATKVLCDQRADYSPDEGSDCCDSDGNECEMNWKSNLCRKISVVIDELPRHLDDL